MSRFQVDSGAVEGASAAVAGSASVISTEVDAMMRHLLDLQSSWQGAASNSFQGVVAEWRATQEQVRSALESIGQALATTGRTYDAAEADAVRAFSR
ncbi:WXG100 family type VII secretion target [Quadrisphaera granulorum]|uniref:ESAT-6-like protein n=1 Tax=Quadrisphaera granulorum TaxID=317664 RepID=A0A316AE35_9ACTN|nr:WXG100 family type VII secretion target [Quadrisphaera granulorum]PWJ55230.1 WXG100 family type VII secretion target [Quadrisphaera granulorum]SZE95739.1 WXG100 family type VII secretion target [Quadrisphaera granulorum]